MASSLKKSILFFTNLNFPHLAYEPFSLDNFDSSEAKAEFRVDKEDIPLMANALQVPESFRCPQGTGKAVRNFTCLISLFFHNWDNTNALNVKTKAYLTAMK